MTRFEITLTDPSGARFHRLDVTISVESAGVGFTVRKRIHGLTGTERYWRPTFEAAMLKVYRLVGQEVVIGMVPRKFVGGK